MLSHEIIQNGRLNKPRQASFTPAGLAGGVTLETGLGLAVFVEAGRATPQALSPLPHEDKVLPTAQTLPVAMTPALVTSGVASLASHGRGVAIVTEKKGGSLLCDVP